VSGSSRLGTSVRAWGEVRDAGSTSNTIIVASGTKYADALSIGPWAYLKKAPIILAGSNGLLTDEEVEAEITKMSEQYGMTADQIRSALGESGIEQLRKDSAMQKAISLIADNAIEV
jgi:hypothetical protein